MPKFHFSINDDERPDVWAVELPDRIAARSEAIRTAGEILRDIDGALSRQQWIMTVSDERGEFELQLTFSISERPSA